MVTMTTRAWSYIVRTSTKLALNYLIKQSNIIPIFSKYNCKAQTHKIAPPILKFTNHTTFRNSNLSILNNVLNNFHYSAILQSSGSLSVYFLITSLYMLYLLFSSCTSTFQVLLFCFIFLCILMKSVQISEFPKHLKKETGSSQSYRYSKYYDHELLHTHKIAIILLKSQDSSRSFVNS